MGQSEQGEVRVPARARALAAALHAASAFLAPLAPAVAKTVVFKKKDKEADADAEPVQINAMSKGTVVERAPAPESNS